MMNIIYENKKVPWKWVALLYGVFGKPFFFSVKYARNNKKPNTKLFILINITPFYFRQNNCEREIGLCFLWWHVGIYLHR